MTSGRAAFQGRPIAFDSAGRPRLRRLLTRFVQAGSSGHARIEIGTVSAPIATSSFVSVKALGRSAANAAEKLNGFASRPVVNTVLPAASVPGALSPAAWTSTEYPGGKTTVTLPPVAPSLPSPQALNVTRLVPIRVARVGAP